MNRPGLFPNVYPGIRQETQETLQYTPTQTMWCYTRNVTSAQPNMKQGNIFQPTIYDECRPLGH
jgi:hypothetical protein